MAEMMLTTSVVMTPMTPTSPNGNVSGLTSAHPRMSLTKHPDR